MSSLAGSTATTHWKSPLLSLESTTNGRSWSKAAVQISPRLTFLSFVDVGFTASPYWHIQIDRTTMILLDPYQASAVYDVHRCKIAVPECPTIPANGDSQPL